MTRSQVALLREGYALIAPRSDSVCLAFCHRLFELDLSLRTLFPSDLRPLTATLATALETLMRSLDDLQPVLVRAPALGLRLASYGVQPADVSVAAAAFLATLEDELGAAFTDATRAAWRCVFWAVALPAMNAMPEDCRQPRNTPRALHRTIAVDTPAIPPALSAA